MASTTVSIADISTHTMVTWNLTNMTMMPKLTMSTADLLKQAHYNQLMIFMFTIVWMSVLMIIGFTGNILTILFYWREKTKSSAITLIIALAVTDFIVCITIAGTIADMFVNILYTDAIVCRFMYFIDHFSIVTSIWILWLISVDRYRKVCKPRLKQLTPKTALIGVGILTGIALVSSMRDFVTFEPVSVNITVADTSVIGHYCTNTDEANLQLVIWIGHIFDAVFAFSVLLTFLFTYGNIWKTLHDHEKHNTAVQKEHNVSSSPENSRKSFLRNKNRTSHVNNDVELDGIANKTSDSSNQSKIITFHVSDHKERPPSDGDKIRSNSQRSKLSASLSHMATKVTDKIDKHTHKISKTERNISVMMFAVSVGFIICFVPYFIVNIGIRIFTQTSQFELSAAVQFGLRTAFWNSVINPIIFCVFNPKYRRYAKAKLFSCSCREPFNHHRSSSSGGRSG